MQKQAETSTDYRNQAKAKPVLAETSNSRMNFQFLKICQDKLQHVVRSLNKERVTNKYTKANIKAEDV